MIRWTPEEDIILLEVWEATHSYAKASEAVKKRSIKAVHHRIARLRKKNTDIFTFTYLPGEIIVPCAYPRCTNTFERPVGSGHGHEKYCSKECRLASRRTGDPDRDLTLCPRCKENPRTIRPDGRKRGWCKKCESKQKTEYARTEAGKQTRHRWAEKKKKAKVLGSSRE